MQTSVLDDIYHNGVSYICEDAQKGLGWWPTNSRSHDRLTYPVPHTGISYNPACVDWDFLVLLEVDDPIPDELEPSEDSSGTAKLAGFIALIKIYLCAMALRPQTLPGNPRYGPFSPPCPEQTTKNYGNGKLTFAQGIDIIKALQNIISQLPDELKLFNEHRYTDQDARSFAIPRVNVYITSLFIQGIIFATVSTNIQPTDETNRHLHHPSPLDISQTEENNDVKGQLLKLRKEIAQELFHIITATPISALKANGIAAVGSPYFTTAVTARKGRECWKHTLTST